MKQTPKQRMENNSENQSSFAGISQASMLNILKHEREKKWRLAQKDENGQAVFKAVSELSNDELNAAIARTRSMKEIKGKYYWDFALQLELRIRKQNEKALEANPTFARATEMIEKQIASEVES